jgi:hypothetical protein
MSNVESQSPLNVTEWRPACEPVPPQEHPPHVRNLIPASAWGILGTLLVHVIALQSFVVLGTSVHHVKKLESQGAGSIAGGDAAAADQTLVLLQPIESANADRSIFEEFASRGSALRDQPLTILSPDPMPAAPDLPKDAIEDPTSDATLVSGDPAGRARLFGIYSGQIEARIERIWRRPRTPVNEGVAAGHNQGSADVSFQCQVQVVQDGQGNVQEVLLPHCNGSVAWQHSLVMAIQDASPLPAPPDPKVFSRTITLNFVGLAYTKGSADDDYEPAPRIAQSANE